MATEKNTAPSIYIPRKGITLPKKDQINSAAKVAGKNPPLKNLKDHPEMDGMNVIIGDVTLCQGDQSNYVMCPAFVFPDSVDPWKLKEEELQDYACTISTGSANFMDRVLIAADQKAFPLAGKLRRGGRAWFLD